MTYLHNTSPANSKENGGSTATQVKEFYTAKVRQNAYSGFFRVLKIMKESSFSNQFHKILEHVWCLINNAQDEIEILGGHQINEGKEGKGDLN